MKIPKKYLNIFKEFIEQEYYYVDSNTQGLVILHSIKNSADPSRPNTDPNNDVQIIYNINVYKDTRPSDLNRIIAKYPNLWTETGRVVNVLKKY